MTMDWDRASKLLSDRIDKDSVSKREGSGGKQLSYIEGWWAIAEANRIFGHGGWSRETLELRQITDQPIGYFAKVRITVGDVVRDGCGFGSGFKTDHEKALKEAETDATKRALMTFGWPLGLALYDKTQEFVAEGVDHYNRVVAAHGTPTPAAPSTEAISKAFSKKTMSPLSEPGGPSAYVSKPRYEPLYNELQRQTTMRALGAWYDATKTERAKMAKDFQRQLILEFFAQGFLIAKSAQNLMDFWSDYEADADDIKAASPDHYEQLYLDYGLALDAFTNAINAG